MPTGWKHLGNDNWSPLTKGDHEAKTALKQIDAVHIGAFAESVAGMDITDKTKLRLVAQYELGLREKRKAFLPDEIGAQDLATTAYAAVERLVPCAAKVRDFLEELVGVCAEHDVQLRWPSPLGLLIHNTYFGEKKRAASFKRPGRSRQRVWWPEGYTDKVHTEDAKLAVTANFTHSADAAHLHRVALAAKAEGVEMASVHDCYACLPSRAARFNRIIREEFMRLHVEWDWLAAVLAQAMHDLPAGTKLPELPPKGEGFDEEGILSSFFAFS
jgi:DNA-directed RNA polymerase